MHKLQDPHCVQRFCELIWTFQARPGCCIDTHLDDLTQHVKISALDAFGLPGDAPRKSWISPATWEIIRWVAPSRRRMHEFRKAAGRTALRGAFR
eukprot:8255511-Karenia_brevis.AAC.1